MPNTRKATREAVTPGIKRRISSVVPEMLWSGFPEAAIDLLLFASKRVKTTIATSKRLEIYVSMNAFSYLEENLRKNHEANRESCDEGSVVY